MIFDGESGQLVSAVLRPGNTHAARGVMGVLRRVIRALKRRFPAAQIVVRGDAGFAVPHVLRLLEAFCLLTSYIPPRTFTNNTG
jgi:hypothetical protein